MRALVYLFFSIILLSNYSCKDVCEDVACLNGGICTIGNCDCPEGFRGEFCEDKILLLKEVYRDGKLDESYEYNGDRSLSRIFWHSSNDGERFRVLIYNYYSDSLIINYQGVENEIILDEVLASEKFFQLGGDTVRVQLFDGGLLNSNYLITSYEADCGREKIEYSSSVQTIDYTDKNCSSIREARSKIDNSFQASRTTTLDDKHGFDESTRIHYFRTEHHGNVLKVSSINSEGEVWEAQRQYVYNEFDYPISCVETNVFDNGNQSITDYTYVYY